MKTYTVRGDSTPAQIERAQTVTIVREGIQPFTEPQEDGTVIQGYTWTETRLSPAETEGIEAGRIPAENTACRRLRLLAQLTATDYVAAKLAEAEGDELAQLRQEYAEILSQRRAWRAEINSL